MTRNIILLILTIFISPIYLFSANISGTITDAKGESLPYVSVYVKNSTKGVSANAVGKYFFELEPGTYTIVFSFIGYQQFEKQITLSLNQQLKLDVELAEDISELKEIDVVGNKTDRAKAIMEKVRENRKNYTGNIHNYKCELYSKTSIEKESPFIDTSLVTKEEQKTLEDYFKKEKLNLIESLSEIYFLEPSKFKEDVIMYNDFSYQKERTGGNSVSIGLTLGEEDIAPMPNSAPNPYIFSVNNISNAFNFYENLIDLPSLCNLPLKSPIGSTSALSYKYEYVETFYENNSKIYKLNVIPRSKNDALFYGTIFIQDSTWALIAVDLSINENSLIKHKNFNIIESFSRIDTGIYLPVKIDIIYTIKEGKTNILGDLRNKFSKYIVNYEIDKNIFTNEVRTFRADAFDKDSAFISQNRPIELRKSEIEFITKADSIAEYYSSDIYLDKQDSLFNKITWWSPLTGIGYKNHYSGIEFMVTGLLGQVVPFGVGGYRHKLPLYVNKELSNGMLLETTEEIDYGFRNKDLKGKIGAGLTYYPKKFVRTFVEAGNTYNLINNYASIEQTFSRSNFVNTKFLEIKQRAEIVNGLYAELSMLYSIKNPINNLKLEKWSEFAFGDLNTPTDFEQYIKSEIKLNLKYRINQKYVIKKNKKIIVGKDYPELLFEYRRGIPGLFSSEVNFDYFEIGAKVDRKLARFGSSRLQASVGVFASKKSLRLLENKFFRGSDKYFFSDPLRSFQLLGPTLNTNSNFWQLNYVHHFNGTILNKVPVVSFMKLMLAAGTGALSIPDQNFYHFEMFAGLERSFKIRKQIFRLGFYAVTAENTLSKPDVTLKFGVSFYNSYSDKWTY